MLLFSSLVFSVCSLLVWVEAWRCDCSDRESRRVVIRNRCSFDLDLGFTGGFAGPSPCKQNQVEDTEYGSGGRCFWNLDLFSDFLEAGQSVTVRIDRDYDAGEEVIWSGQIYAMRSPHIKEACAHGCGASRGATGTVTLSEFTMLAKSLTYYDVSHVHGANIPATFGPPSPDESYRNGVAAGNCSWVFEPPPDYRKYLIEVKNVSNTSCSDDADCGDGEVCGASFSQDNPVYGTCGSLYGYLNAHTNCIAGSKGYPFYCELYHDLYGCSGQWGESGYSQGETEVEHVCGCSDYSDLNVSESFPCVNSNPMWIEKAYEWVHYIKKACPSAYEYPYSDSTSTFTSDSDVFELIYCPGDSEANFFVVNS